MIISGKNGRRTDVILRVTYGGRHRQPCRRRNATSLVLTYLLLMYIHKLKTPILSETVAQVE